MLEQEVSRIKDGWDETINARSLLRDNFQENFEREQPAAEEGKKEIGRPISMFTAAQRQSTEMAQKVDDKVTA